MRIADSLRRRIAAAPAAAFAVFLETAPGTREAVRARVAAMPGSIVRAALNHANPFLFAQLTGDALRGLIEKPPVGLVSIEEDFDGFDKRNLTGALILEPLLSRINATPEAPFHVIIDVNQDAAAGRDAAIAAIVSQLGSLNVETVRRPGATHPYIFATLRGGQVRELAQWDQKQAEGIPSARFIYKIWEDAETHALINRSVSTVKADAAQIAFSARGSGVVWAVLDSGIDSGHAHFAVHHNLDVPAPVHHVDFTATGGSAESALADLYGHGTHVAGILAGESANARGVVRIRHDDGGVGLLETPLGRVCGMAPECKLVSMKVLDGFGRGRVSWMIDALEYIQKINDYGRRILIHGVNLSAGYGFDPEWFACGQSPLCVEVNRLVKSGVVVVVAAGNSGYRRSESDAETAGAGQPLSINDPGNAEHAITVGSTHRFMPHTYGVSYFSSKGPTGDGRRKPDLVAPGEKILSCAAGRNKAKLLAAGGFAGDFDYQEDSGASMAAPHVSGAIAAFLSIRPEFQGEPAKVKEIFLRAATDLGRDPMFQGAGLVDLMRAIQSV